MELPAATTTPAQAADNVAAAVPDAPIARTTVQDVIAAVKAVAPDFTEEGAAKLTREQIVNTAKQASDVLQKIGVNDATDLMPTLRSLGMREDELSILRRAAQSAFEETGKQSRDLINDLGKAVDPNVRADLQRQIDALEKVREPLGKLDVALSSTSGSDLASRVGGMFTNENRGLSVTSILREQGINDPARATDVQKAAAQTEFNRRIDAFYEQAARTEKATVLKKEITEAAERGDFATAEAKAGDYKNLINELAKEEAKKQGLGGEAYDQFNRKVLDKVNEYVISTVFTPSTVIVNFLPAVVKTAYKPFVDYLVKGPFDQAAFREMTSTYAAMYNFSGAALQAAKAAYKYERSLLTGDVDKFLEGGPAIAGLKGRVIRTFPRMLSASDEFFAQINYRGYVIGQATSDAVTKGVADGLKGKALDAFVKDQVAKAVDNAYSAKLEAPSIIGLLRDRGIDRGLTGEALTQWIKVEFEKNGALFKQAMNETGRNYVDDLLFKREFSGTNQASRLARGYERFVNNNPAMRILGQLFFRTPVRVFEEGMRLTPGVNLITPNFISDLKGLNGTARQVRAQGEAMLGYSIAASVMAMYANGAITGGGPSEWKQRRGLENSKKYEPYTIVFKDGSTFSFRNLDPFATPLKILVNALDRYQMLEYRRRQGEYVGKEEKEILAWFGVGVGSVAQAIRDANLAAGFDQGLTLAEALADPEAKETMLTKFFGQKAQLAVPNVLTKTQQQFAPMLTDPASIEQFFKARINPADPKVPKRYDALGNVVQIANPGAAFTGINITTPEMREAVVPKKTQEVLKELSNIEIATSSSFQAPFKRGETGDLDLRLAMTADGSETLYDRWNRYVAEMNLVVPLHNALVKNKALSYGSKSYDGLKIKLARDIISDARDAAFARLMAQETGVSQRYIQELQNKNRSMMGGNDASFLPFTTR